MKIYTKTGDDGTTGLLGGKRVEKSDPRIDCIGAVDAVNAAVGLAAASADQTQKTKLHAIQNDLFVIGSHMAVPDGAAAPAHLPPLEEALVKRLESEIDAAESELTPLRNFILPGGCETAARLHLARTICRDAERKIVSFSQDRTVAPLVVIYLNRLSDWLFVQGSWANKLSGVSDVPWKP